MKNATTNIIFADHKAIDYICKMRPVQAKKVLYGMTLLQGDQRLQDSPIPEVRNIAQFYNGAIQAKFAKELAGKLAKAYSEKYPKTLITKKELEKYTHANYRKLLGAVGEYGFDYVLTVLRQGKAYASNHANAVNEEEVLKAMRWDERRPDKDKEQSDVYHHLKGLELVGFDYMAKFFVKYSFIIANVYELVEPVGNVQRTMVPEDTVNQETKIEANENFANEAMSVREMKIHFIREATLIQEFYNNPEPLSPAGYAVDELVEGSVVVALAKKNLLNDSEIVLEYIEEAKRYEEIVDRMSEKFTNEELEVIRRNKAYIKELIKDSFEKFN